VFPVFRSATSVKQRQFWRVSYETTNGDVNKWGRQMDRHDQELLDKQMGRLSAPRNHGVIAVMLAVMFVVGMTIGGVVFPHQSEPTQIASIE
jgi:hypothetical protein